MKVEPTNQTFGIYQNTRIRRYGKIIEGVYKGYEIDIYIAENKGNIEQKLFYVKKAGEWIKSKLIVYSGRKKFKILTSNAVKNNGVNKC